MGAYLYMYLEIKDGDIWRFIGELEKNIDYDPTTDNGEPEYSPRSIYEGTNPFLTSLLGDLRYPVLRAAGKIFAARGLPYDLSSKLREWAELFKDATGHSWLSLKELCQFDWESRTELSLAVPTADVSRFLQGHRRYDGDDIEKGATALTGDPAVQVLDWHPAYSEAVGTQFMNDVVIRLCQEYGVTDATRLVYWLA